MVCALVASDRLLISQLFSLIFNTVHGFVNQEMVELHVYDFQFSTSCIFHKD